MRFTQTLTEGVLPLGHENVSYERLSEAMLKWHGLSDNSVMTPNVVGAFHIAEEDPLNIPKEGFSK